jgi:hypothetical protein
LVLFLTTLTNDFEHVCASHFYRSPLPILDQAIIKPLLKKKLILTLTKMTSMVLYLPLSRDPSPTTKVSHMDFKGILQLL